MATPESAASPEASARKQNSLDAAERRRRLRKSSQQQYLYMDSMASHMMVDDDDDDDTAEEDNNDEEANHHENNTKTVENNEDEKEKMEEEDHESNNNTRKEVHSSASDVCHPKERREIETELPKRTRMIRRSSKMDETEANISLKEDFAGRKKKSTVRFAPETMKSTVAANSENKQHAQEEEGACQQQEEKTDGLAAAQKETTHRSAARASRSRPNRTDGPPRRETQHLVAAAAKKEEEELPFNECPAAALPNKQDEDEDEFCFDLRNDGTDERNDPWLGAAVFGSEEEAMLAAASSTHQQQQNDDDDRQLEKRRHNGTDERFVPGLGSALCLEEGIATEDEEIKLNQVCEEEKDELFDSSDEEGYCEDHISQQDNRSAKRPHRATRQMKIQEDNKKHIQQQETSGKLLVQYSSSFCARHKGRMGYGSPIPYRKAIASTLPLFLKGDNLQRTTIIESLMNRFEFYDSKSKSMLDARSAYHKIQRAFFRKMGSATFFDTSASNETPVRSSRKRSRKENVLYTQDEVKSHEDEEAPTSTRKRQRVSPPPQRVDSKAPSSSEKLVVRHQRGGRHDQYGNVDFMRHVKLKSMEYKSAMEELSRDAIVDEFMARYDIQSKKANTGQWTTLEATLAREKIAKTLLKQSGYSKQLAKVTDSPSTERSNDKPKLRNKEAVNKLLPQIKESKFKKGDRRTKSSSGKLAKTRLKDSCYIKKFSTLTYSSSKKNSKDKSTLRSTATVENRLSQLGVSDNEDNRPTTSNSGKQIVYCGHGSSLKHYPGNIAFVSFVHTHRAEYLHFKEERDRLIDEAFGTFEFRKDWEVADPIWAKSKLHKALIEARRKPPRFSCDNAPGVATEQQPSKYLHTFRNEDTPYIEELAYHHYAGLNPTDRVSQPIPKPKPVPKPFSDSTTVKWTYNETTRVYLVDFSNVEHVSTGHKQFLGELMERDDITVICEGLLGGMPVVSTDELLNELADSFRKDPYHRFRRFQKTIGDDGFVTFVELDHFVSMKVSDFVTYLAMLQGKGGDSSVVVYDPTGKPHTITASEAFDIVFYMVDVDMPKWLFTLNEEYKNKFKIKEILPGGAWCLMNYVRTDFIFVKYRVSRRRLT